MNDCSPEIEAPVEVALQGSFSRAEPVDPGGEADVLRSLKRTGSRGTWRGTGPSALTQIVEITSGRANFQQGLTATCKDLPYKDNQIGKEDFGLAHESV